MQEEWRQVDGYDNYEVSNFGRVRNKTNNKILARSVNSSGHMFVRLSISNCPKKKYVHRLVAFAFIDNPMDLPLVDHKDHDTSNNHVSNLRWCDKSQNAANSIVPSHNTSGFKGVRFSKRSSKWTAVIEAQTKRYHLGVYSTAIEAAKAYNDAAIKHFGEFALLNDLTPKPKIKVSIKPRDQQASQAQSVQP